MQAIFGDLRLQDLSLPATTLPQIHAGVPELSEQDCNNDNVVPSTPLFYSINVYRKGGFCHTGIHSSIFQPASPGTSSGRGGAG